MKNIFDYLITDDGSLNEDVFDSFSHWMFEGGDPTNTLSREFLRWSVLAIMKDSGDQKPDNSHFYSFFQSFDRTDYEAFLNHVSKYGEISVMVEQFLGTDESDYLTEENQSVYWYFFGTVMEHVDQKNLFPEEAPKVLSPQTQDRGPQQPAVDVEDDSPSEEDLKGLTSVFSIIFAVLMVAFFLYNFFVK